MALQIERLGEGTFPLFRDFAEHVWDRPSDDAYYCWRYREAPGHLTLVAHQDGRCLATLSAFERPYSFAGQRVDCLETFDWFCLPELRGSGLGIRIMRKLMDLGRPVVALGGSDDTVSLLPRLGFKTVATGHHFTLPFSGAAVRATARNGLRARATAAVVAQVLDVVAPVAQLARRSRGVAVECIASSPAARLPHPRIVDEEGAAIHSIVSPGHLEWLTMPRTPAGCFLVFRVNEEGTCIASAVARIYRQQGVVVASLLDVRWSVTARTHLDDLLRGVASRLRMRGAQSIVATTTCEATAASLRAAGFHRRAAVPALIWPAGVSIPDGPVRLSAMRGDGGLFPLPTAAEATL